MVRNNPDASVQEIGKLLGEAWAKASKTTKFKYIKQNDIAKEEYQEALKNMKVQNGTESIKNYERLTTQKESLK
eukprot:UN06928